MSRELTVELIRLIPSLLWVALAIVLFLVLVRPLRRDILPRMGEVRVFGVEMSFLRGEMERAAEKQQVPLDEELGGSVFRRAQLAAPALRGARVLWIDDHPGWNVNEQRIMESLGVEFETATSAAEGLAKVKSGRFDLVISDMDREGSERAGLDLLERLRSSGSELPVIFYVTNYDASRGTPPDAVGMTDGVDQLLHYVMDALERHRL